MSNINFKSDVLIKSEPDKRNYKLSSFNPKYTCLGDDVDILLKLPKVEIIMEQEGNSCVAHALTLGKKILEYQMTNKWMDFNCYLTYGYRTLTQWQGQGMYLQEALNNGVNIGFFPNSENDFNYTCDMPELKTYVDDYLYKNPDKLRDANDYQLSGYAEVTSINEIREALSNGMPVIGNWGLYKSFFDVGYDGIVSVPDKDNEEFMGYHTMLIVGIKSKERQFVVANSYGIQYGFTGIYFIPFDYMPDEMYAISDSITPAVKKCDWVKMRINDDSISYSVNGCETSVDKIDTVPVIVNSRTYIPASILCKYLGCAIKEETQDDITIISEESVLSLSVNSSFYVKNNQSMNDKTYSPYKVGDTFMIPVRLVSEVMNCKVDWNNEQKEVTITAL